METRTKKISIRIPQDRYTLSKEKSEGLNMTYSEYLNLLVENDLRENGIALNQRAFLGGLCSMSTHLNNIVENYPDDNDVIGLKREVRVLWQILSSNREII